MVKHKKAQMKIQQTAFMLIAVTLFFALVGMFILIIVLSNVRGSAALIEEQNALTLVSKLANSAEFSCGDAFGSSRTNCVDADKVMALKNSADKYSSDFWSVEGIEIVKIYPAGQSIECNSANYPNCNMISIVSGSGTGIGVSNFVSLCRKEQLQVGESSIIQDKCELARLIVTYDG